MFNEKVLSNHRFLKKCNRPYRYREILRYSRSERFEKGSNINTVGTLLGESFRSTNLNSSALFFQLLQGI